VCEPLYTAIEPEYPQAKLFHSRIWGIRVFRCFTLGDLRLSVIARFDLPCVKQESFI